MSSYALIFQQTDTIAVSSHLNSGETSFTLTSGNFSSPSGTQLYVVDYDIPGSAEIISATVVGTAVTGVVRGLTGGAAGTTNHAAGAKVGAIFVPQHYDRVANRTLGYAQVTANQGSITSAVDLTSLSVTVTVPVGNARIKITTQCQFSNTGTNYTELDIKEGATVLMSANTGPGTAAVSQTIYSTYTVVATAGSHTYKLTAIASGGTSTLTAAATEPCYILVENIE